LYEKTRKNEKEVGFGTLKKKQNNKGKWLLQQKQLKEKQFA